MLWPWLILVWVLDNYCGTQAYVLGQDLFGPLCMRENQCQQYFESLHITRVSLQVASTSLACTVHVYEDICTIKERLF